MDFDFSTETITPDNSTVLTIGGNGALMLPVGTSAQRPVSPAGGMLRLNSTGYTAGTALEYYDSSASAWEFLVDGSNIISGGGFGVQVDNVAGQVIITSASGGAGTNFSYNARTNTQTAADPADGNVVWNSATLLSSTQLYISAIDGNGIDQTNYFNTLNVGAQIYLQDQNDSTIFQRWSITSITYNVGTHGWYTIGVTLINSNNFATISNNHKIYVSFSGSGNVTSFRTSLSGLTPSTATAGPVVLAGTLGATSGGTGLSAIGTALQVLRVNAAATGLEYATLSVSATPGGVNRNVQYNDAGIFGGTNAFNFVSGANPQVNILGTALTTQLTVGGTTQPNNAAFYVEVNGDAASEGIRTYFKRSSPGINGWITYDYDGATPNLRLTDEDDDSPYIQFNVIGTGTYSAPQYNNSFGGRGPVSGATTGFSWKINGVEVSSLDSQWLGLPGGTTAQRPGTPVNSMLRYNSTLSSFEFYQNNNWVQYYFLPSVANNTILAGPTTGGPLIPTFRTISLLQNDISDVVITSPSANQVLAYNSGTSKWVNTGAVGANATGTIGVSPTGGGTAWSLISGSRYYADFVHNLGTTNVVITVFDTTDSSVIIPQTIVTLSATTIRVTVTGNTKTLKVVVVANGQSIVAGGSTPASVITAQDGVTISTAATKLNFTGQAVKVVDAGAGTTNIGIGSRFTFFANSLDTPNNADYAINALAPVATDPTYTSLNIRSFSNTTETGVGCLVSIPSGATQLIVKIRGRAQTAPGSASVVQPRMYYRLLPNNSAVGAWSAAQELANITIPTNANFQYATQTIALSTLGLVAGNLYQIELTRRITGVTGTNLAANFLMAELTLEIA